MLTVGGFIDELGGNQATALIFGVGASAVSNWRAANALPARLHLRALRIAQERALAFDPERPASIERAA